MRAKYAGIFGMNDFREGEIKPFRATGFGQLVETCAKNVANTLRQSRFIHICERWCWHFFAQLKRPQASTKSDSTISGMMKVDGLALRRSI
jgi:hypothetical protein